jgi:hypothetical protein
MDIIEALPSKESEFQIITGMGCFSTYQDSNGLEHKIIVLYLINGTSGVQIIIDGTSSVYDLMKNEYKKGRNIHGVHL